MKLTTNTYQLKKTVFGNDVALKSYTFESSTKGPEVYIQASIHGAEVQGNAVILSLMNYFSRNRFCGRIIFVPLCNPEAVDHKLGTYTFGRFNAVTGHNWNRNFIDIIETYSQKNFRAFVEKNIKTPWSSLKKRFKIFLLREIELHERQLSADGFLHDNNRLNLVLQKLSCQSDIVFDLHTGPYATRYLYAPEYLREVAPLVLCDNIIVIPTNFFGAMDEAGFMPWVHLVNELRKRGRKEEIDFAAFTVELGSEEQFSMADAEKDMLGILNFLAHKKVIDAPVKSFCARACLLKDFRFTYASTSGLCDYLLEPGAKFKKGDLLASIFSFADLDAKNPISSTKHDALAPSDGIVINRTPTSIVREGMELFQIMTNVFKLEA